MEIQIVKNVIEIQNILRKAKIKSEIDITVNGTYIYAYRANGSVKPFKVSENINHVNQWVDFYQSGEIEI